jgi:hypothetical protein
MILSNNTPNCNIRVYRTSGVSLDVFSPRELNSSRDADTKYAITACRPCPNKPFITEEQWLWLLLPKQPSVNIKSRCMHANPVHSQSGRSAAINTNTPPHQMIERWK